MARKRRPIGSTEKRGPGRYRIGIPLGTRPDGTRERYREMFYGTEEDAEKRRIELLAKLNRGKIVKTDSLTFGEYLASWVESYAKTEREESTYKEYKRYAEKRIIPALGKINLSKLARKEINAFYSTLRKPGARKDGKPGQLSASTVHRVHAVVHSALEHAVNDEIIEYNPATGARLPTVRKQKKRVWTGEQLATFLDLLRDHPHRPLILTLAFTGTRISEVFALKWDDIDFERKTIRVDESLKRAGKNPRIGDTKNHQEREIPMDPLLEQVLRSHRREQYKNKLLMGAGWNPLDLLFTTEVGSPMHRRNFHKRVWKPLIETSGLPYLNIHGLRHTFGTVMMGEITDPKVLSDMMGHHDVAFTLREYNHPGNEERQRAMSAFSRRVSSARN